MPGRDGRGDHRLQGVTNASRVSSVVLFDISESALEVTSEGNTVVLEWSDLDSFDQRATLDEFLVGRLERRAERIASSKQPRLVLWVVGSGLRCFIQVTLNGLNLVIKRAFPRGSDIPDIPEALEDPAWLDVMKAAASVLSLLPVSLETPRDFSAPGASLSLAADRSRASETRDRAARRAATFREGPRRTRRRGRGS